MPARPTDDDDNGPDPLPNNSSRFPQSDYTNTSSNSQQKNSVNAEVEKLIAEYNLKKQDESWVRSYWRPAMGWLYMVICAFDFIIFPLITMFLPVIAKAFGFNITYSPWVSLTLSNGGLIHMAFGAILGVAAWSRGQEKIQSIGR
jgi:hypothetical protein